MDGVERFEEQPLILFDDTDAIVQHDNTTNSETPDFSQITIIPKASFGEEAVDDGGIEEGFEMDGNNTVNQQHRALNIRPSRRWKGRSDGRVTIPYTINRNKFTSSQQSQILEALRDLEDRTGCLKFVQRNRERHYIRVDRRAKGCFAAVGKSSSNNVTLGSKVQLAWRVVQFNMNSSMRLVFIMNTSAVTETGMLKSCGVISAAVKHATTKKISMLKHLAVPMTWAQSCTIGRLAKLRRNPDIKSKKEIELLTLISRS